MMYVNGVRAATVDDVRARDTVFDQFIRHRARVGVGRFRASGAATAEASRGESIGDVSTADDVERAGAIFTIRFGERIAVESGDEIDARAAETKIRREDDDDDVETESDEDDAVDVDARRGVARERVDDARCRVAREGRARGVGDAQDAWARPVCVAGGAGRVLACVYGSSMTRSTGEECASLPCALACARWKAVSAASIVAYRPSRHGEKSTQVVQIVRLDFNTCAVISCALRWCVYARV